MTQREFERELARATGETVSTLRSRGFSLLETPASEPRMVDWDAIDEERVGLFPARTVGRTSRAA
jgi:hypothetical protein